MTNIENDFSPLHQKKVKGRRSSASHHLSNPVNTSMMLSQNETYASGSVGNSFIRISLACVPCRSRHVKCDAIKPRCTRCDTDGKSCYFVDSRRGRKPKASSLTSPTQIRARREAESGNQHGMYRKRKSINGNQSFSPPSASSTSYSKDTDLFVVDQPSQACRQGPYSEAPEESFEKLVDHYYTYFHNPHPFLLPKRRMIHLFETEKESLGDLLLAVGFVGSTYTSAGPSLASRQNAIAALSQPGIPQNGYSVQALLILAISVHCCDNFSQARELLDRAINIAVNVGLFAQDFALENGGGDPICEESWRRTWWYLYVVDGWFAAIDRNDTFVLFNFKASVDLPCEEREYSSEEICPPHTLALYDRRDLDLEETHFSSFTYLVDVVRMLGSVMRALNQGNRVDLNVHDIDAALVNWELHLPKAKRDVWTADGDIDEILFQAHMLFNVISVALHRPHSHLHHSPIESTCKCAPTPPPGFIPPSLETPFQLSTFKTITAASRTIKLFTLPTPFLKHTPLVVCGVALSILAQLSACSHVFSKGGREWRAARERIKLGIGTLKQYGETWEVGQSTLMEIKRIAMEVLEGGGDPLRDVERTSCEVPDLRNPSNQQRPQDLIMPGEELNMTNDRTWNTEMDGAIDIGTIFADANFQDCSDDALAMDDWNVVGPEGRTQLFVL